MREDDIRQVWRSFRPLFATPRLRSEMPHLVAELEAQYHQDANPLHVWQAYALVRAATLPTPPWVLAYFDRVAETLHVLSIKPPGERQVANAAVRALELPRGGRRNVFLDWPKQNHAQWISSQVQQLLNDGHKLYEPPDKWGANTPHPCVESCFRNVGRRSVARRSKATTSGLLKNRRRFPTLMS